MARARFGVRTRILAIAMIPSLTLLVVGVGAAAVLVDRGRQAEEWAAGMQRAIAPTVELIAAVQSERQLTMAHLAGDTAAASALPSARSRFDNAIHAVLSTTAELPGVDDNAAIGDDTADFNTLAEYLARIRSESDFRRLPIADAYGFYNKILDIVITGSRAAQDDAPAAEISVGISDTTQLLSAVESMSRSYAAGYAITLAGATASIPIEEFVRETGYYHATVGYLANDIDESHRGQAKQVLDSTAWAELSSMENAIVRQIATEAALTSTRPNASDTRPGLANLPLTIQQWQAAADEVTKALKELWIDYSKRTQMLAEQRADESADSALIVGVALLVVSLAAIATAVIIANRTIRRLKKLQGRTLELADRQLPRLMQRLRDGEPVDPEEETPDLQFGYDEIGQVATAFQQAHGAAVAAAITEARTREGVQAVFLNIAHRSQVVVHKQLEILDEAERREENPQMLDTLFKLDHLATRERRNAENLVILGGGKTGRQWRAPVLLMDVVRSAVGETLDYERVHISRMPEVYVNGAAVADLIHLLAEILDNATSFSPPETRVDLRGSVVGRGAVLEIADQGLGMSPADMDEVNEKLGNPPGFGVTALTSDSRLGVFVIAQLAARHSISIRLVESDHGGIRAIVLIPTAVLINDGSFGPAEPPIPLRSTGMDHETQTYGASNQWQPSGKQPAAPETTRPALPIRHPGLHIAPNGAFTSDPNRRQ